MVSGFDKYFQTLRALGTDAKLIEARVNFINSLEMSFVEQGCANVVEKLLNLFKIFKKEN